MEVDVKDAAIQLEAWLERVAEGEEILLLDSGTPVGKLIPYKREPRKPGGWAGKVWIAPDFDEFDAEIEAMFYGEDDEDLLLAKG